MPNIASWKGGGYDSLAICNYRAERCHKSFACALSLTCLYPLPSIHAMQMEYYLAGRHRSTIKIDDSFIFVAPIGLNERELDVEI